MRYTTLNPGGRGRSLALVLVCLVLVCLLSAGLTTPLWSAEPRPAWVIPECLIVRSGPGSDNDRIATLSKGTKIHVTAFRDSWCRFKLPDGRTGWVAEWLLQFSADKGRALAAGASGSSAAAKPAPPTKSSGLTAGTPAWISVLRANVRQSPSVDSTAYGQLDKGVKVFVLERKGDWYKCKTPGGSGWLRQDLLEFDPAAGQKLAAKAQQAASAASAKAYVAGDNVRLRSGPGTKHDIVATLKQGQTLYVVSKQGGWVRARVHGGAAGWISGSLIKYETRSAASASSDETRDLRGLAAWIGEDRVNVRYAPGLGEQVKSQLTQGSKVFVLDMDGHWLKVKYGDESGWIAGWCLDFSPPGKAGPTVVRNGEKVPARVGLVATDNVNVREGPDTSYDAIGRLDEGDKIVVIDQKGSWYQVAIESGKLGWIASWLIDTREKEKSERTAIQEVAAAEQAITASLSSGGSDAGSSIVRTAMAKLGCSYSRGNAGPNVFDCSGLVYWVHKQHGINLTRSSADMIRYGRKVPDDQLQPGDVVFFQNTYRPGISHVGIYIGNGDFVHAANARSGVRVSSLSSSYYAPRYVGAHRMY